MGRSTGRRIFPRSLHHRHQYAFSQYGAVSGAGWRLELSHDQRADHEVNSPQATLRAARAGLGIAMVPDFIARPYIQSGELVTLFDDYISKDRGIYAVYPHRR